MLTKGLPVLALLLGSITANAQFISSGTSSGTTARNCVAGTTGCDSVSSILFSSDAGLPGQTSSSAALVTPGFGQTSASAALTGVIGAPILTAEASSTAGTREGASAFALQSYTYTGASSITDTFSGVATYSQAITGSYPGAGGTGTVAGVEVFTLPSGALFNAGITAADNAGAMGAAFNQNSPLFGITQAGFALVAMDELNDPSTNMSGTLNPSVTVTLTPGETIWVMAGLEALAPNGSTVDPTLKTGWSNSANLVPGAISAPEIDPSSAASALTLLLGALLVLCGRRGAI